MRFPWEVFYCPKHNEIFTCRWMIHFNYFERQIGSRLKDRTFKSPYTHGCIKLGNL